MTSVVVRTKLQLLHGSTRIDWVDVILYLRIQQAGSDENLKVLRENSIFTLKLDIHF